MRDAPPQRRFFWLRRLLFVAVAGFVALVLAGYFAVQHLDWLAQFAIHRIFPGVTAEMGSLRVVSATRLEVSKLALRATKTKEPLLTLEGGVVVFSFGDLWRARLQEVRLASPDLVVSPDLGEALGVQPAKSLSATAPENGGGSALKWAVGRLVVTDGRLRITRFGERSPSVEMAFVADFQNFGVDGEAAAREHATRLTQICATDASGRAFLRIADADLRFTTEELFTRRHLRTMRLGAGTLTIAPDLLDFFQPGANIPAAPAAALPPPPPSPGWSVGLFELAGLGVTVPDAPGQLGRIEFRLAAQLHDLGAIGTPAAATEQTVSLSRVKVSTDREPAIAMLTAARAEARFTIAGLAARRLEDLRFKNLSIDLAPATFQSPSAPGAPLPPSAPNAGQTPPAPWLIAHTSCKYATLRLRNLMDGALDLSAKFAFDTRDLGTLGDAAQKSHELTVWDTQAGGPGAASFLTLDVGGISFTPAGLAEKRIEAVKVNGGRLTVGEALQKLLAVHSAPSPARPPAAPAAVAPEERAWSVGTLDIAGVRTRIEDKRPGVPDIHFTINTTLRNIRAGGAAAALLEEVQTVEFANIDLQSPINRNARIFSLRSVFVRFTLRDLVRKHLREIVILRPTIFLSQDLFVYMERATAGTPAASTPVSSNASAIAAPAPPNWSVDHLEVKFGRLVLGSGGSKDVGLPLEFETTADNLALDNLATLQLQAILRVPKQSYEFPDYQIAVKDVVGDLRFSYPPEKGEKNLVQKLDIAAVRWRQYRADKTWVAATFDASGINGLFGGAAYGGYINGGFSFFFQEDSPWIGWVAGTGVDTKSFTEVISPQNFRLTGPLNFEMQLDAFRKNISRVRGVFHLTEPGELKIGKLDDLLANIPDGWTAIKQSSTRLALETLRDFDYTTAGGDFWFVDSQGILNLDLLGPHGSRKFEVALHDGSETQNQWQHGKLGKK